MSFKAYCEQRGIELLREDMRFVRDILSRIPKSTHKSILRRYTCEWLGAFNKCDDILRKQNEGRREANTWLREYCK